MSQTGPGISHYLGVKAESAELRAAASHNPGMEGESMDMAMAESEPKSGDLDFEKFQKEELQDLNLLEAPSHPKKEEPGSKEEKLEPKDEELALDVAMPPADSSEVVTAENFREVGFAQLKEELTKWGSPVNYLRTLYSTADLKNEFAAHLLQSFPKRQDLAYASPGAVPANLTDQ